MKLVIEHFPWVTDNAYGVSYVSPEGHRTFAKRFSTEAEARAFCEHRAAGRKVIAEYEVSEEAQDGS